MHWIWARSASIPTASITTAENAADFTQLGVIGSRICIGDQGSDAIPMTSEIVFPEETAETPAENIGVTAPITADTGIVTASVLMLAAAAVVLKNRIKSA